MFRFLFFFKKYLQYLKIYLKWELLSYLIINYKIMMEEFIYENVKIDTKAPDFTLPFYDPEKDTDWKITLSDLKWKWTVLFFYPADFTFVCPTELKDMADRKDKFKEMWVEVLSISTDSIFSHRAWIKQEKLMEWFPYKMLSDHWLNVSEIYNLLDEESAMAWRWTFVIDPNWIVKTIEITSWPLWRNSDELIRKIEALQFMAKNPWVACPAKWAVWAKTLTPNIKISGEVFEALN